VGAALLMLLLVASGPVRADGGSGAAAAGEPAVASETPADDPVTLGVDFVSRYAWRGQLYGETPCAQPWASAALAGFTLGFWGSFPLAVDPTPAEGQVSTATTETDVSLARSLALPAGTVTATVTDYHFPSAGAPFGHFEDGPTGAHTVEAALAYRGPDRFPLAVTASRNIHHDPDHASYIEASWPVPAGSTDLSFTAGAAFGKSAWYGVEKTGVHCVQVAATASRTLQISDAFTPAVKVTWMVNPNTDTVTLVAALSI
jgi:hypothetical protein